MSKITLSLPAYERQHVLEVQGKTKASKGLGQYSQEQTILSILREHKDLIAVLLRIKTEHPEWACDLP